MKVSRKSWHYQLLENVGMNGGHTVCSYIGTVIFVLFQYFFNAIGSIFILLLHLYPIAILFNEQIYNATIYYTCLFSVFANWIIISSFYLYYKSNLNIKNNFCKFIELKD